MGIEEAADEFERLFEEAVQNLAVSETGRMSENERRQIYFDEPLLVRLPHSKDASGYSLNCYHSHFLHPSHNPSRNPLSRPHRTPSSPKLVDAAERGS